MSYLLDVRESMAEGNTGSNMSGSNKSDLTCDFTYYIKISGNQIDVVRKSKIKAGVQAGTETTITENFTLAKIELSGRTYKYIVVDSDNDARVFDYLEDAMEYLTDILVRPPEVFRLLLKISDYGDINAMFS